MGERCGQCRGRDRANQTHDSGVGVPMRSARNPAVVCLLALSAALALLVSPSAWAAQTVLALTLELEGTTDWARVEVSGLQWRVTGRQAVVKGTTELGVGLVNGGLLVKKAAMDLTHFAARLDLAAVPTGEPVAFLVTRGDLGKLRVRLSAGGKTLAEDATEGLTGAVGNQRILTPEVHRLLTGPSAPRRDWGRRVLAFYYGWWGLASGPAGENLHWKLSEPHQDVTNPPLLGPYDSADPKIIAQHVAWAKLAGIDTLVLSWWNANPHQQLVLTRLLDECQRQGLTVALYMEQCSSAEDLRAQLETLLRGPAQHAAWLTVHGQKVVFLYTRIFDRLDAAGLRNALFGVDVLAIGDQLEPAWLEVLGGLHSYVSFISPAQQAHRLSRARQAARLWDKLAVGTVMPGYDDTNIRFPGTYVARDDGRFLTRQWAAAAQMDWVVLTSFNELHEGSEIEPTQPEGVRWLHAMHAHVEQWKAGGR